MPQPQIPFRKTVETFPSPVVLDSLIWELIEFHANEANRLSPGTPHPDRSKYPGFIFVKDEAVPGTDSVVRRWWSCGEYQLQDTYNWGTTWVSESGSHPSWARRYLIRRDKQMVVSYTPRQPFTGVFLLRVDNPGENYATKPVVTITGDGTGATAEAIMSDNGTVAWVKVTAEGEDYTTATATFSGGGGTGASATVVLQGDGKLIHQEVQPLDPGDPRYSEFLVLLRVWETLPGPLLLGKVLNTETGIFDSIYSQVVEEGNDPSNGTGVMESQGTPIDANRTQNKWRVAGTGPTLDLTNLENVVGWKTKQDHDTLADFYIITGQAVKDAALPAIATGGLSTTFTFDGQTLYLVDRSKKPLNSAQDEWTLIAVTFPQAYKEYKNTAVRFPGIFTFLQQFSVPFTFPYRPPFPGIHYNYLRPRTNGIPARATYFFTDGLPSTIPQKFTVITPGTESKNVPMQEDTVHSAFQWFITQTADNGEVTVSMVENIPASSPETYDPMDIYVFDVDVSRWNGNIFRVTIIEASEGKAITYFPPVNRGTGLTIGEYGGGLPVADYIQSGFYAVNTEAGGPHGVQLFGFLGPTWTRIQGTTSTDAGLVNLGSGVLNTLSFITGDGVSHSEGVQVYVYGEPGTATVVFTSNPVDDDQIRLGFLNGDGTYNTTWTFKDVLSQNALATGTLTLSGNAVDGETVTISRDSTSFVYTWRDDLLAKATGTISLDSAFTPSDGETVTVGLLIYTFKNPFVNSAGNVYTGASGTAARDNLFAAINRGAGEGTLYGGGTSANTLVIATGTSNPGSLRNIDLEAITAGEDGDDITISTTGVHISVTPFAGGISEPAFSVKIGASASASIDNLIAAINLSGTAGTEYSTGTTINTLVSAAAGTGDTMDVDSFTGGTTANDIATTDTMTAGGWDGATLSGAGASVAYEVQIGATAADTALNFQKAVNASGTAGTEYSTGTLADPILLVPAEVSSATFTVATRIGADWTSFGSWQTGGNFAWIETADAFPVNTFGTVGAMTGATNGTLLGELEAANHSLVCNFQDFDDSQMKTRNFPPTPDDLTTSVVQVGNRAAQIWFGQFGGMPIKYQKSVDGVTNWIDGDVDLNAASVYPPRGTIRKVGITDFDDAEPYRYIRFVISPATEPDTTREYGPGKVSRQFLQVVWSIE